jgi:serine protease Do
MVIMFKRIILTLALFVLAVTFCFGQASALRDFVGLVSISYHPDIIELMKKSQKNLENKGYSKNARAIDVYLQGLRGSGFVYVAADGNCYILTNEHVVTHADTLTITFEKQDGSKTVYDQLKVLYVDEETDLAILSFNNNAKPFTRGLSFNTTAAEEGTTVFAAGFPALGNTAAWQYTQGIITNAAVRLPKNSDSDETTGPYIQHSAQVDPGNSGGPLLVARQGVPANHAVIGINTLSARWRQAANYAIPISQVNTFLASALSNRPVNDQELIAKKVDEFVKGLGVNKAVYNHIADYISNACVATNAEHAIMELLDSGSRSAIQDIDGVFSYNPVEGMRVAVAWYIESVMRSTKAGAIKASVDSITPNDKGGFTAAFDINGTKIKSEWIKEYGIWRMQTFGDSVSGNKDILNARKKERDQDKALVTDFTYIINGGYINVLGGYGHAIHLSAMLSSPTYFGFQANIGLTDLKYLQAGMFVGYAYPIRLTSVGFIPFADIGGGIQITEESKREPVGWGSAGFPFATAFNIKGGLMFTTAKVSGLVFRAFYEHSIIFMEDQNNALKNHGAVGFSIGYGQ